MTQEQYKITKERLAKFEKAIAELKAAQEERSHIPAILRKAELSALESVVETLRSEINSYEAALQK
jgi:hypothetical protein